jgi:hypothetical protein
MINPKLLLAELVEKLKAIPELYEIEIVAYDEQSTLQKTMDEAIASFGFATGVLVAYESGQFPRTGEVNGVRHRFTVGIISQDSGVAFDILTAIYNGVPMIPLGDGLARFYDTELQGCNPIDELEHRSSLDENGNQLWAVTFVAVEKQ